MAWKQFRSAVPYVIGLAAAVGLYVYVGHVDYTSRAGQLGPDTWPKMALALMGIVCAVEIARHLVRGATVTRGVVDLLDHAGGAEEEGARFPWLLAGGIVLVSAYALLVTVLGFLLATFLFLAGFMYLGRYRNHLAIWSVSVTATVLIAILFLRIAYVSLPRGEPPFDRFTDFVRLITG